MLAESVSAPISVKAEPDFRNLLAVLRRQVPDRPTLFEFFLNDPLYDRLAAPTLGDTPDTEHGRLRRQIHAFRNAGYDYVTLKVPGFVFPAGAHDTADTISLNDGAVITDRAAFDAYPWPDPETADYDVLQTAAEELPDGMKAIVYGPFGVFENVIRLVGYDRLCFMLFDEPDLSRAIFDAVGSRLLRYYQRVLQDDAVGAIISNDDWGFKTQPLLSPPQLREFVFPWHQRIAAAAHQAGRPAILHSCGNFATVIDDTVETMRFDAKHSYEDAILPIEEAYEQWHRRIALVGGIDVDFICRSPPEAVFARARALLEQTADHGGYALGTGNSVPEYVPDAGYFAMIRAAVADRDRPRWQ